jgi:molybdate transport system regulatory protein
MYMETSARNVFCGKVVAVHSGAVNDEVELAVEGGPNIVASITQVSTKKLGLKPGVSVTALIKASFVLLVNDAEKYLLSTRNQFPGTVGNVTSGAVNGEVVVEMAGGGSIASIVTMGSINKMGLQPGKKVTAIVKASQVILAVPK